MLGTSECLEHGREFTLKSAMVFPLSLPWLLVKSTGQRPNLSVQKTKVCMTKVLLASSSRSKPSRQLWGPAGGGGGGGCRGLGGRQGSRQLLERKMHVIRINDVVCFKQALKGIIHIIDTEYSKEHLLSKSEHFLPVQLS